MYFWRGRKVRPWPSRCRISFIVLLQYDWYMAIGFWLMASQRPEIIVWPDGHMKSPSRLFGRRNGDNSVRRYYVPSILSSSSHVVGWFAPFTSRRPTMTINDLYLLLVLWRYTVLIFFQWQREFIVFCVYSEVKKVLLNDNFSCLILVQRWGTGSGTQLWWAPR